MSDHLQLLALEAKDCTEWTQHCGASCCKELTLHLPKSDPRKWFRGGVIRLSLADFSDDQVVYLSLHNGIVTGDEIRFYIAEHNKRGHTITLFNKCAALKKDLSCGIYSGRPKICRRVNDEDVKNNDFGDAYLVKDCLYKYKLEAQHGKG